MYEGRKRTPIIYSKAIKAHYGTVDAAKVFYDSLIAFLVGKLGFIQKPYDPCVANKYINSSQYTIMWHVDDLKLPHKDSSVITYTIDALYREYADIMPLTVSRGRIHGYLGMVFDYSTGGEVLIQCINTLRN